MALLQRLVPWYRRDQVSYLNQVSHLAYRVDPGYIMFARTALEFSKSALLLGVSIGHGFIVHGIRRARELKTIDFLVLMLELYSMVLVLALCSRLWNPPQVMT